MRKTTGIAGDGSKPPVCGRDAPSRFLARGTAIFTNGDEVLIVFDDQDHGDEDNGLAHVAGVLVSRKTANELREQITAALSQ